MDEPNRNRGLRVQRHRGHSEPGRDTTGPADAEQRRTRNVRSPRSEGAGFKRSPNDRQPARSRATPWRARVAARPRVWRACCSTSATASAQRWPAPRSAHSATPTSPTFRAESSPGKQPGYRSWAGCLRRSNPPCRVAVLHATCFGGHHPRQPDNPRTTHDQRNHHCSSARRLQSTGHDLSGRLTSQLNDKLI